MSAESRRPGDEGVVRSELEQLLTAAGRRGLAHSDLAAWAEERKAVDLLSGALEGLTRSGLAVSWNRRWIAVRHTDWTAGRVKAQARGGALLLTGQAGEAGYFVPAAQLKGARDGDLVLVRPMRRRRRGRGSRAAPGASARGRLPEATVVKMLARGARELVGFVEDGARELVPFDSRSRLRVRLPEQAKELVGHYAVAALPRALHAGTAAVEPKRLEDLGALDEAGTDVAVILRHFQIPDEFTEGAVAASEGLPEQPDPADFEGRIDQRRVPTITIDGESARDFDDAISIERNPATGGFSLAVHIADVAHYVAEGGVLDLEAYDRGTSVYFPDRAVPMLPEGISNGLCSLKPGVERLALTAFLEFSAAGEVTGRRFGETVICSDRRFTYEEVRKLLAPPEDEDHAEYIGDPALLALLRDAEELMRALLKRRTERGSIDFDLPEGDVILDTDGVTVGVKPGERNLAHRMIEEFMIAANEAVAAELVGAEVPALYRIHTEPDRARFEELRNFLEPLGVPLDLGPEEIHPSHLQEVLRRVEGHPEEPFVATLILRAMKRAVYDPDCQGHYALASRTYTHFTSPIRRYPDLVVHRALKRHVKWQRMPEEEEAAFRDRLEAIAEHSSATERRAERAERTLLQWKVVRLLTPREGEIFAGRVTGVQKFGLFIQLEDYYVDGLLPIAALEDDYYTFEPEKHRLVGRKGNTFRLADRLEVKLATADPVRRLLTLAPAT